MDGLLAFANKPTTEPSVVRQIMVPTTLSGAEFGNLAGALDTTKKLKTSFIAPDMVGRVIALDPWAAVHTPEWLWLSTAIRSVDHAIEGYCALRSNPFIRGTALHALRLFAHPLVRGLVNPRRRATRAARAGDEASATMLARRGRCDRERRSTSQHRRATRRARREPARRERSRLRRQ